jgi:xanthine/CO dehydrogenase XdhC/CoxF family maturation factor
MKHWQETRRLLDRLAQIRRSGQAAALATVVRIEGSAYRRPGAKLLIEADGRMSGSVSGGCLEADVREVALGLIAQQGGPRLLHYDTSTDQDALWGLNLGCNGAVDIFVRPFGPTVMQEAMSWRELFDRDSPFAVSMVVAGGASVGPMIAVGSGGELLVSSGDPARHGPLVSATAAVLASGDSKLHEIGEARVFTEVFTPPPHLIVCGAGDDAIPLVAIAAEVGFRVTVVDHRPAYLAAERFPAASRLVQARPEDDIALPIGPRTYALVKMHALEQDRGWLRRFLATEVPYIGVLGPRARTEKMLAEIGGPHRERVYGPVGLDLGAEGPEQVALSIVSEVLAVLNGRDPGHLRDKSGPIHST